MKVTVIMLTWKRPKLLPVSLNNFVRQTYKDFNLIISHSDRNSYPRVEAYANNFKTYLNLEVRKDSNEEFAFRRLRIAREAALNGADVILFVDDDVEIPLDYIEKAISQYEPKTYKSNYAWKFEDNGVDYYSKRVRIQDRRKRVNYCGTAMSMVDASIFLEDGLLDAPPGAIKIEDLWLSYYAQQVMKWKLAYLDIDDIKLGGKDNVALFRSVTREQYDKKEFLRDLVKMGWKL